MLNKIRGLWRFDGDEEPVRVSRRSFFFMGGVVAAGMALPGAAPGWSLDEYPFRHPIDGFLTATMSGYRIEGWSRLERLRILKQKEYFRDDHTWIDWRRVP